MDTRIGRILSLRLQGMGFRPADARALARLWEAGGSKGELLEAAQTRGYGPAPALEAALEDIPNSEAEPGGE